MTETEFETLSEELKRSICREIAYDYVIFVPKDTQNAISKFKSFVNLRDKAFLDKNVLKDASGRQIFPYQMILGKIDNMVEAYYREFLLGINPRGLLANYGSRGEGFHTYFADCLKASENTTKNAVEDELVKHLRSKNDAKAAIKGVGDVIVQRTRSLDKLLGSLSAQMEQYVLLWEYQDQGYTKYRINGAGASCEACQGMNGKIFEIADAVVGETLSPLHPNCDCAIEILDEQGNVVRTHEKTAQEGQGWGKYIESSLKQLVLGNYTDDGNLLGTLLQVLAGVVGVDLPMDIRDLLYDVTNFEFTKEHIAQTLLDAVAFLPVIGGIKYADEAGDVLKAGAKSADEIADAAKTVEKISPTELIPTHKLTLSKKQYSNLVESIQNNGITESIKYVEHSGNKYVVDGHHRLRVAKQLGLDKIPAQKVSLPYKGYKTIRDLLWFE